jgi:glutamine amidotransferase
MKVIIIKYNAGNVCSVLYALERMGIQAMVSDNPDEIRGADRVIFPGVGEASTAMAYLKDRGLNKLIPSLKQPVLGICLGQQLMCRHSEEGNVDCLGIFPQQVKKFTSETYKIPQMGWNDIYNLKSPLFAGVNEHSFVYFVHGYYVENGENAIATVNYILPYSAALRKGNFFATQFHPEKSGDTGHKILENFMNIRQSSWD